jgi:hypothetical protein
MKAKVEKELDRLQQCGILEPVERSEWGTPIVPIAKKDGSFRLCGDYKLTLNPALEVDRYPVPKIEDLFTSLSGGKYFTKLDLAHAYQQILLDTKSRQFCTINTHKGLYRCTRIPYGIPFGPGLFLREIEQTVQGLDGVIVYFDDILITGSTVEEHDKQLEAVLSRLQANVANKQKKVSIFQTKIAYLGHILDAQGLHTDPDKVAAIQNAPYPTNVTQLRSILGLVNYYARCIP